MSMFVLPVCVCACACVCACVRLYVRVCLHSCAPPDVPWLADAISPMDGHLPTFDAAFLELWRNNSVDRAGLWAFEEYFFNCLLEKTYLQDPSLGGILRKVADAVRNYCVQSSAIYGRNPALESRRVLTGYVAFALLDHGLCHPTESPDPNHGLPPRFNAAVSLDALQYLLLPTARLLKVCHEVEELLRPRVANSHPSILSTEFPLQFAVQDTEMKATLERIIEAQEAKIAQKKNEVRYNQVKLENAQDEARSCSHEKHAVVDSTGSPTGRHECVSSCRKCGLEYQIRCLKESCLPFCKWLPDDSSERSIVAFELLCDPLPRDWRNLAVFVNLELVRMEGNAMEQSYEWLSYFRKGERQFLFQPATNTQFSPRVSVSSIACKWMELTHYQRPQPLNTGSNPDDWILPNGGKVESVIGPDQKGQRANQMFAVADLSCGDCGRFYFDLETPYSSLQFSLRMTEKSTQNTVIAKQHTCPREISLREFVTFGSLRVGHVLQYHHFAQALESRTLSLGEHAVLQLICQSAWQAEPAGPNWWRVAHQPLRENEFAHGLLDKLAATYEECSANWDLPVSLAGVVVMTTRILHVRQCVQGDLLGDAALELIRLCRATLLQWLERLEQQRAAEDTTADEGESGKEKLSLIATCGLLTYLNCVGSAACWRGDRAGSLTSSEDVVPWLKFAKAANDHAGSSKLFAEMDPLNKATGWTILPQLSALLARADTGAHPLSQFVGQVLAADERPPLRWTPSSPGSYWWAGVSRRSGAAGQRGRQLEVHLLNGAILTDGQNASRLPQDVVDDPLYKRTFGNHRFAVRPLASSAYEVPRVYGQDGVSLQFQKAADGSLVILLRRRTQDGLEPSVYTLIPTDVVSGHLPTLLTRSHSHWYTDGALTGAAAGACLYFLPLAMDSADATLQFTAARCSFKIGIQGPDMPAASPANMLEEFDPDGRATGRRLLPRSHHMTALCQRVVCRLEDEAFVHVWQVGGDDAPRVDIDLPRFQLQLTTSFDEPADVRSRRHANCKVASVQNLGTLTGLSRGLVLESPGGQKRLLMPFSLQAQFTSDDQSSHPTIDLVLPESEDAVRWFEYTVHEPLRTLQTSSSVCSWLYLALLHGLTSHLRPDRFTGLTGAEAALMILQSPRCCPTQPFEDDSLQVLASVRALSPVRKFYPDHLRVMTTVRWPSLAQHSFALSDAFAAITRALEAENSKLAFLFPQSAPRSEMKEQHRSLRQDSDKFLMARAYSRHRKTLGPQAQLKPRLTLKLDDILSGGGPADVHQSSTVSASTRTAMVLASAVADAVDPFPAEGSIRDLMQALYATGDISPQEADKASVKAGWIPRPGKEGVTRLAAGPDFLTITHMMTCDGSTVQENMFLLSSVAFHDPANTSLLRQIMLALLGQTRYAIPVGFVAKEECHIDEAPGRVYSAITRKRNCYHPQHQRQEHDAWEEGVKTETSRLTERARALLEDNTVSAMRFDPLTSHVKSTAVPKHSLALHVADIKHITKGSINSIRDVLSSTFQEQVVRIVVNCISERGAVTLSRLSTPSSAPQALARVTLPSMTREWSLPACRLDPHVLPPARVAPAPWDSGLLVLSVTTTASERAEMVGGVRYPCGTGHGGAEAQQLSRELQADMDASFRNVAEDPMVTMLGVVQQHRLDFVSLAERYLEEGRPAVETMLRQLADALPATLLDTAGLRSRLVPLVYLPAAWPRSCGLNGDLGVCVSEQGRSSCLEVCRAWTSLQKATRIHQYLTADPPNLYFACQELIYGFHDGWDPVENPGWLLFELEWNLGIRERQAEVAQRMINPPGRSKHAVMQLNMGEGKSAVILPVAVNTLANREDLVRVVVPPSLLQTTLDDLALKLGGLLNRRVLALPCRRDMSFEEKDVGFLADVYRRSREQGDIVVSTSAHILSFQLKAAESVLPEMKSILSWLFKYSRDVLDESDEILHYKRQLVYTIGQQQEPDAQDLRWRVVQGVLAVVRRHAPRVAEQFNSEKEGDVMEFFTPGSEEQLSSPPTLSLPRFLQHSRREEAFSLLAAVVTRSFLSGDLMSYGLVLPFQALSGKEGRTVTRFVLSKAIPRDSGSEGCVLADFIGIKLKQEVRDVFCILRGLLAYEVLLLALSKRWRVDYGIDRNRTPSRWMAVPFRAKDRPSANTEFGHVEFAVVLTHLTYYRGGLLDADLQIVVQALRMADDPATTYDKWVEFAKHMGGQVVPPHLASFSGVTLSDPKQRCELFSFLRFNPRVIDFFLNHAVFTRELKQFPHKLVASSWNMAPPQRPRPLTGFSGTNDTKWLLPHGITQEDIPELTGTNAGVLQKLMLRENNSYTALEADETAMRFLDRLVDDAQTHRPDVLIDVGAFILLDNAEVAREWLRRRPDATAVIYFEGGRLVVATQQSPAVTEQLRLSPFQHHLAGCLVYLDEEHTRGTDLRLPGNICAAVTLGQGLTRDRFVQGCMRMRQLGRPAGHTLKFYAPHDVHLSLRKLLSPDESPGSVTVIQWVLDNTRKALESGILHWVQQASIAVRFEEHLYSHLLDGAPPLPASFMDHLLLPEAKLLSAAYATQRELYSVPRICDAVVRQVSRVGSGRSLIPACMEKVCAMFTGGPPRFNNLVDEEQERELEQEQEEERQLERPPPRREATPNMSLELQRLVTRGDLPPDGRKGAENILTVNDFFRSIAEGCGLQGAWQSDLRCTKVFQRTVLGDDVLDEFVRPVAWVVLAAAEPQLRYVFVSPYEAQHIAMMAYNGQLHPGVSLRLVAPRLRFDRDVLIRDDRFAFGRSPPPSDSWLPLESQALLFSGSLFFSARIEQELMCVQLGLCCLPHTAEEKKALDAGVIQKDMFVSPPHRQFVGGSEGDALCKVTTSVVKDLRAFLAGPRLLENLLPDSHVGVILRQGTMIVPGQPTTAMAGTTTPRKLLSATATFRECGSSQRSSSVKAIGFHVEMLTRQSFDRFLRDHQLDFGELATVVTGFYERRDASGLSLISALGLPASLPSAQTASKKRKKRGKWVSPDKVVSEENRRGWCGDGRRQMSPWSREPRSVARSPHTPSHPLPSRTPTLIPPASSSWRNAQPSRPDRHP